MSYIKKKTYIVLVDELICNYRGLSVIQQSVSLQIQIVRND